MLRTTTSRACWARPGRLLTSSPMPQVIMLYLAVGILVVWEEFYTSSFLTPSRIITVSLPAACALMIVAHRTHVKFPPFHNSPHCPLMMSSAAPSSSLVRWALLRRDTDLDHRAGNLCV